MKKVTFLILVAMSITMVSCKNEAKKEQKDDFKYLLEQFSDLKILRYQVPGFDSLSLNQKKMIYFLSQAALAGRDIIYDQNCKYNLEVRKTIEGIVANYKGDRNSEDFKKFMVYAKRVWFSNGIHHHYSSDKFFPEISKEAFAELVKNSAGAAFPMKKDQNIDGFLADITPIIYDPNVAPKKVSLDSSKDLVLNSSVNFYEGVTQAEAESYYAKLKADAKKSKGDTLISFGLNSTLVKEKDKVVEKVWKEDGLYGQAITKIIYWLGKAAEVAENEAQKAGLNKLIEYYQTGSLKTWDDYNILWVQELEGRVDYVNGFIEDYEDPMGTKATWESVVNFKDMEATKKTALISSNAQWFEDNSPVDPRFKKKEVKGVSAKVITVAQLGGDCHPATPIGINLPNADWIRKDYGSKSVTMGNIMYSYDQASLGNGFLEEFAFSKEEIDRIRKYGFEAGNLTTDLHECLGHGSGQLLPGTNGQALKNYQSALEESRADLFALYYIMDQKMVDLGLLPSLDGAKAEYDHYIRNGLMTQLTRIELGKNIEQAHMRNRQLIAGWVFEKGKPENVIEFVKKGNNTYVRINDYTKLRTLFGELLKEIQRIKSEGDYKAGKNLVETYGVKVDPVLHKEVRERFSKLNIAPYSGFINPVLVPVMKGEEVTDIKIEYPEDFVKQMMDYGKNFSFLPVSK